MIAPVYTPPLADVRRSELPTDLEGACRTLEKEFARLVFQKMREAMVPKQDKGAGGFASSSYESMLDEQWAELASRGEGLGLWRAMASQLQAGEVKSGSGQSDQEIRGNPHRMDAGRDPHGGSGAPGHRPDAPDIAAVTRAGLLDRTQSRLLRGAGLMDVGP